MSNTPSASSKPSSASASKPETTPSSKKKRSFFGTMVQCENFIFKPMNNGVVNFTYKMNIPADAMNASNDVNTAEDVKIDERVVEEEYYFNADDEDEDSIEEGFAAKFEAKMQEYYGVNGKHIKQIKQVNKQTDLKPAIKPSDHSPSSPSSKSVTWAPKIETVVDIERVEKEREFYGGVPPPPEDDDLLNSPPSASKIPPIQAHAPPLEFSADTKEEMIKRGYKKVQHPDGRIEHVMTPEAKEYIKTTPEYKEFLRRNAGIPFKPSGRTQVTVVGDCGNGAEIPLKPVIALKPFEVLKKKSFESKVPDNKDTAVIKDTGNVSVEIKDTDKLTVADTVTEAAKTTESIIPVFPKIKPAVPVFRSVPDSEVIDEKANESTSTSIDSEISISKHITTTSENVGSKRRRI